MSGTTEAHESFCQREEKRYSVPLAKNLQGKRPGVARLFLFAFQRSAVTGLLHRSNQLVGVGPALFDLHDGLVWIRDLRADHSRDFFECGPHSLRTIDRSGHSRNGKVHSFVLFLHFGCLRSAGLKDRKGPKGVSCREHHCNCDRCFKNSHARSI